jgi:hypothetical protein
MTKLIITAIILLLIGGSGSAAWHFSHTVHKPPQCKVR